jgi:ABC-type lipoprotein export system ATPase subunit/GNAT superfamily N-acetyltransferase
MNIENSQEINKYESRVVEVFKRSKSTDIKLDNGEILNLPYSSYIRENDLVEITAHNQKLVEVRKHLRHGAIKDKRWITLLPPYKVREVIYISPHELNIVFRERRSLKDWKQAKRLEQFHYRGQGLNKIVGRRSVLLAEDERRGIIAYGVVCATLPLAKPRFELFETDFKKQMHSKLINQIVRIPRIVVHPEYRGMGLGTLMAKHLVEYVRGHWDIAGYAPILVEVIAAMMDYHHFFESAGFIHFGDTKGYKGKKLQPQYGNGAFEARENIENYRFLEDQSPKPYLIFPLTPEVEKLIKEKTSNIISEPEIKLAKPLLRRSIVLKNVSVTYKARNGLTKRSAIVKDVFGIDETQMFGQVINEFSLSIDPGDVVLFTGASGSGKSTIIKLLTQPKHKLKNSMDISGIIEGVRGYKRSNLVGLLSNQWDDNLPLIDQVGDSLAGAINLLNKVGLAEAHLYLKRPTEISEGQKYRFAVSLLCSSKKPIWVADEFASTLDPETAAIVARGLRRMANQFGATLILAAPHIDSFVESLLPNTIVRLSWGDTIEIRSVRLEIVKEKEDLLISIANRSAALVEDLQVGCLDDRGKFRILFNIPEIEPRTNSEIRKVNQREIRSFKAMIVQSPYKIGDITYISC